MTIVTDPRPRLQALRRARPATRNAVAELGLDVTVAKVTDYAEMARMGVMSTPALAIDGTLLTTGQVPSVDEVKRLLTQRGVTMPATLDITPKTKRPAGERCDCAPRAARRQRSAGRPDRRARQGARRPRPPAARRRPARPPRPALPVRAAPALRHQPADARPPPQGPAQRRHPRLREARALRLLLRAPRRPRRHRPLPDSGLSAHPSSEGPQPGRFAHSVEMHGCADAPRDLPSRGERAPPRPQNERHLCPRTTPRSTSTCAS